MTVGFDSPVSRASVAMEGKAPRPCSSMCRLIAMSTQRVIGLSGPSSATIAFRHSNRAVLMGVRRGLQTQKRLRLSRLTESETRCGMDLAAHRARP